MLLLLLLLLMRVSFGYFIVLGYVQVGFLGCTVISDILYWTSYRCFGHVRVVSLGFVVAAAAVF